MSAFKKRVKIPLDRDLFAKVEEEAARTGRSVAAVIREAIDLRFASSEATRASAAAAFLSLTEEPGPGEEWADVKAAMAEDPETRVPSRQSGRVDVARLRQATDQMENFDVSAVDVVREMRDAPY